MRTLDGLVDIYMPDFKYMSSELSERYSSAPDYKEIATAAICEMHRQRGKYIYDVSGMLKSGVLVRHLVLPGERKDSIAALRHLAETVQPSEILLSVMSQYTPEFAADCEYKNLHRKVTDFEYSSVVDEADRLGFEGFVQGRASASSVYTPDFKNEGKGEKA